MEWEKAETLPLFDGLANILKGLEKVMELEVEKLEDKANKVKRLDVLKREMDKLHG